MIKGLRLKYTAPALCRYLKVSESGYYAWHNRKPSKRAQEEARLTIEIKAIHKRTRRVCGAEKLQKELADNGAYVGISRIKRIKREQGLYCKQTRKYKATTDSAHKLPVADNILNHTKNLVSESLFRAVAARRPAKGLIHHSDRGSQYCAYDYRNILEQLGMTTSMSRKGNCYDNAPMEGFWGTLKQELIHHHKYRTRQEAMQDISEYIEVFSQFYCSYTFLSYFINGRRNILCNVHERKRWIN